MPITLRNPKNDKEVTCFALLDSGADCNLFAPVLGEIIGIDVTAGIQKAIGGVVAGERRSYFEHGVELIVGGCVVPTRVGFMPDLATLAGEGIVGQTGFFDRFTFVKFKKRVGEFELGKLVYPNGS